MGELLIDHDLLDSLSGVGDRAFRLYFDALFWCARHKTGCIMSDELRLVGNLRRPGRCALELTRAGVWEFDGTAYVVSAFDELVRRTGRRERLPAELRAQVFERDQQRCVHCGSTSDLAIDHIKPWSHFGPDSEPNLQVLCGPCNSRKGTKV